VIKFFPLAIYATRSGFGSCVFCGRHKCDEKVIEIKLVILTNGGDDDDRIEERAGEGPLVGFLVFRAVPAVFLHGGQQVLLELLEFDDDALRPVFLAQDVAVLSQLPEALGAVVALVLYVHLARHLVFRLQRLF